MTDKRKFAALAALQHEPEHIQTAPATAPVSSEPPKALRGRPSTGKRSNPDYQLVTHYLRRSTKREAEIRLLNENDDRDFSELLQELLENWLKQ